MRYSTTLVLAAVVVALAVLVLVFKDRLTGEAKPPETPAATTALIEGVATDDVTKAQLEESGADGKMATRLVLEQADGKWRLAAPVAYAADDYEAGRLVRAAIEAKYRQTLEHQKDPKALAALGLDPPAFRLTLTVKAKDSKPERAIAVDIGKKSTLGEGLYARLAETDKAVVLERADLLDRAREKVNTYRRRDLVGLARDDVVRIDLETEKGLIRLDRAEGETDKWVIAQPLAARADPDAASALVRAALGTSAKEFVADAPKDLVPFGLDQPRLTLTLWKNAPPPEMKDEKPADDKAKADEKKDPPAEAKEAPAEKKDADAGSAAKKAGEKPPAKPEPVKAVVLRFGSWADIKKDKVHVLADDGKTVASVDAATYKDLARTLAELRDKHVVSLDTARAARATLRVPARLADTNKDLAYELVRADGSWKVHVEGRPEANADSAAVEALLKEIAGLKVLYFAEGDQADLAKGFAPQGAVRIQMEGEAAPRGFEIAGTKEVPTLVKNLQEDWIGRVNEKDLEHLRKDWLACLDKEVLTFDPKQATRVTVQVPDRQLVLEKKDEKWRLTKPVDAEPRAFFADDLLRDLKALRCEKFVAAGADPKGYSLDPGELVLTVALAPAKDGEPAEEKVLRLAHHEKARIVGRADGADLIFEVPPTLLQTLAGEPLAKTLTDLKADDVKRLEVTAATKVTCLKVDEKWFRADAAGRPGEQLDAADKVAEIAKAAAGLIAARWAAYDAKDLARFGLDKPDLKITLTVADKTTTVLVSAKEVPPDASFGFEERPARFAMLEGGERVALLTGPNLRTLLDAPKTLEPTPKPEPPKPEPAKPKAKPDAPKPEAPKPEPAKPEAPKPKPAKPEAPKPEPAKPEAQP